MKIPKEIFQDIQSLSCDQCKAILIVIMGKLYRLLGTNGLHSYWLTIKKELKIE